VQVSKAVKIPKTHRLTRLEVKLLHAVQALERENEMILSHRKQKTGEAISKGKLHKKAGF
jgi:hypothetical protein